MEKLQFDSQQFCLYSPDSLNFITEDMQLILENKLIFYKKLFNVSSFRKVQINYFDDKEKFRNFIYSLRNENTLPEYATGTFDNGMINAFIPAIIFDKSVYNKKKYMSAHELFHIMYKELICDKNNIQRVIWFDEGMAQLFSGEYNELLNQNNFDLWLENLIENTKEFPNLNELTHGTGFENKKYSGYKLSFLATKYLYDSLNEIEFKLLMNDTKKIKKYGENVIDEAITYYKKINIKKRG